MSTDYEELRRKRPEHVPVILKAEKFALEQQKRLFPRDMTFSRIKHELLQTIDIDQSETVFFLVEMKGNVNDKTRFLAPNGIETIGRYDRPPDPVILHLTKESAYGA
jgi:hypothetical protein